MEACLDPEPNISPDNPTVMAAVAVLLQRESILVAEDFMIRQIRQTVVSVDRATPMDCWSNFRFRKEHSHDIMTYLRIPNEFQFGSPGCRGKVAGEKAFLFTLHRLATVGRLVDYESKYGRSYDQLSRIFT